MPWQWVDDGIPKSAMTIITKDVGIVMDEARLNLFPEPLSSQAEQIFTAALGAGLSGEDDGNVVKLYERFGIPSVQDQGDLAEELKKAQKLKVEAGTKFDKVLLIGLGNMGIYIAASIKSAGLNVTGYNSLQTLREEYTQAGGEVASDVSESVLGSQIMIINVSTASEAETVLFGDDGKSGIASGTFSQPLRLSTETISTIERSCGRPL